MTVFDDIDSLSQAAASAFVSAASEAIAARGRFVVTLSGGSTPKRMLGLLANDPFRDEVDWTRVFALFGDERYVPPDDPQSNEKMARETLLDHVPIPPKQVFGMYRPGGPEGAAAAYEGAVRGLLGSSGELDLVYLGLGPDGHTASLFPGDPSVHEQTRWVVAGTASANARERVTMTPPLLTKARSVLFLIAGADKAEPLQRLLNGPLDLDQTPSQAVGRFAAHVEYFVDRLAWPG